VETQKYKDLPRPEKRARLLEITRVFLRLGVVAFGGPAAHTAMMEEEIVSRRRWLSREKFLDLMGATHLIPGPNSTELAIHLGYSRGGLWGLLLAGACFILPAMAIVLAFAALYVRHGQVSEVEGVLYGIKPVIIAVVLQALLRLGKSVIRGWLPALLAAGSAALYFLGVPEVPLLLGAGAVSMLVKNWKRVRDRLFALPLFPLAALQPLPEQARHLQASGLFFTFLKIGSVLYGSGYVLLAFLESEFVARQGVLTSKQLLDAVAVGQFTPGPVFTTATFVGYLLGGFPGAFSATAGIFLPSFLLVFLLNPLIPRMRASLWFGAALDGVNAASLALMAAVSFKLALASLVDPLTAVLFAAALLVLMRTKISSFWLILLGGLAGFVAKSVL